MPCSPPARSGARCSLATPRPYTLSLDKGVNASTYLPRQMINAGTRLNYNLYTDSAQTTVWGDGTGGTVTV
jgi:spore coat protein U-like protein